MNLALYVLQHPDTLEETIVLGKKIVRSVLDDPESVQQVIRMPSVVGIRMLSTAVVLLLSTVVIRMLEKAVIRFLPTFVSRTPLMAVQRRVRKRRICCTTNLVNSRRTPL